MKNFKILFGFAVVLLFLFSCSKDADLPTTQEIITEGNTIELRKGDGPCGKTGFDVLTHITDKERCFGYGFYWWNGKCIVCR